MNFFVSKRIFSYISREEKRMQALNTEVRSVHNRTRKGKNPLYNEAYKMAQREYQ